MTKKDYIALADIIRDTGHDNWSSEQVSAIANYCESQNPNFSKSRWIGYIHGECGPNGGKVAK